MESTAELTAQLENAVDKYESALKGASPDVLTQRPDEKNWAVEDKDRKYETI